MGIGPKLSGSRQARAYYPSGPILGPVQRAPNPDPANFRILASAEVGPYSVVLVQYPGCTNYEGRKCLVYKAAMKTIRSQDELDPHFMERGIAPIARFRPTDEGWQDALRFVGVTI